MTERKNYERELTRESQRMVERYRCYIVGFSAISVGT